MSRTPFLLLTAVSTFALSACATSHDNGRMTRNWSSQLTAKEVTAELKIDGVTTGDKLDTSERDAVKYFAAAYAEEGHGSVFIQRPANGPNDIAGLRAAADAKAVLLAEGLAFDQIVEGPYDASGRAAAPLLISYKTWEAVAPNCPDISQISMTNTVSNESMPSFGCALAVNLAAQIADPADLIRHRKMDPADLGRRQVVLTKYRNGEETSSARSDDASGAISEVVE